MQSGIRGGDPFSIHRDARQHRGPRPGSENDLRCLENFFPFRTPHRHQTRTRQTTGSLNGFDPGGLEEMTEAAPQILNNLVFAVLDRFPIHLGLSGKKNAHRAGVGQAMPQLGGRQQGLGRDAAEIQAGAAGMGAFFHQRHLGAVMRGLEGGDISSGTRPHHHHFLPLPVVMSVAGLGRWLGDHLDGPTIAQTGRRIFQPLLEPVHKARRQHPVDDAMVAAELHGHDLRRTAFRHRPADRPHRQNAGLGRIHDRRKLLHSEHSEVRDGENPPPHVFDPALPRRFRQSDGFPVEIGQREPVGMQQHRHHDTTFFQPHSHPEMDAILLLEGIAGPAAAEIRKLRQGASGGLKHQIVDRGAGRILHAFAVSHEGIGTDRLLEIEVRNALLGLGESSRDRRPHRGKRNPFSTGRDRRGSAMPQHIFLHDPATGTAAP